MKRIIILCSLLFLSACSSEQGTSVGYVYAVDSYIGINDTVWVKTSLQSSESDCYRSNDKDMTKEIKSLIGKKIVIEYSRSFIAFSECDDSAYIDTITSVKEAIN